MTIRSGVATIYMPEVHWNNIRKNFDINVACNWDLGLTSQNKMLQGAQGALKPPTSVKT